MFHNIGYGRVSKLDVERMGGRENNLDIAANQQRRRLERSGCTEIYFDVQRGTDDDRPNFEQLMKRVEKEDRVNRVTITRDDRITRNLSMTLHIINVFRKAEVELVILEEGDIPIDLNNVYEWKRRVLAGVDAEFEVKMLQARVKRGMEDLRQQRKANPRCPFGYARSKEGYYIPHPEQYPIARDIVETLLRLKAVGPTCKEVNAKYGMKWNYTQLKDWAQKAVLRGHTPRFIDAARRVPRQIDYGTHPEIAIVSAEEDREIARILEDGRKYRGRNRDARRYPLGGGLCRCARCDGPMTCRHRILRTGEETYYLECDRATKYDGSQTCDNIHCPSSKRVESAVIQALTGRSEELAQIASIPEPKEESYELMELRRQLEEMKRIPGNNLFVTQAIAGIEAQIKVEEEKLDADSSSANYSLELFQSLGEDASNPEFWETRSPEIKRLFYHGLIDKVIIDGVKLPDRRWIDYQIQVLFSF